MSIDFAPALRFDNVLDLVFAILRIFSLFCSILIATEMVSEKNISYTAATEMVKRFRDE